MAAGATYEPIATQTLGSASASIDFTSIASSWTDLRVVLVGTPATSVSNFRLRYNSDGSSIYSYTELYGTGSTAASARVINTTNITITDNNSVSMSTTIPLMVTIDIFSYAGSTYKTALITNSQDYNGTGAVNRYVGLYRSTSAITAVNLSLTSGNIAAGTTATLYGIKAA